MIEEIEHELIAGDSVGGYVSMLPKGSNVSLSGDDFSLVVRKYGFGTV